MRPYIEFLQSQNLPWTPAPRALGGPEAQWKVLSSDDESGAVSSILRWGAGTDLSLRALASELEIFVLQGSLCVFRDDGTELVVPTHGYLFLPPAWPLATLRSRGGATALVYTGTSLGAAPAGDPSSDAQRVGPIDSRLQPWDAQNVDPNINHLRAARKNLRLDPAGGCRTYLLGGPPHGFPADGARLETHPHVEEFFLVSGDIAFHVGIMRAGAYFWRPPGIPHGQDCTLTGYLLFCRTPGTHRTVSEWAEERRAVSWTPPHAPRLPPELAAGFQSPAPDPIVY